MKPVRGVIPLAFLVAAASLSGCARKPAEVIAADLHKAIDRISEQPYRFYVEFNPLDAPPSPGGGDGGGGLSIDGFVEDDGRYKAQVMTGGAVLYEEVASDDALAVRVSQPDKMGPLLRESGPPTEVTIALRERKWVLDPSGAADRSRVARVDTDVVARGANATGYLRQLVNSRPFLQFNPDDLQYNEEDDPFPKPSKDGPVKRFDMIPPRLPTYDEIQGLRGQRTLPEEEHFSKCSVYVRDGFVVEARCDTRIENRERDLPGLIAALELDEDTPEEERVSLVRADINRRRAAERFFPLQENVSLLKLSEIGRQVTVTLPDTTVRGDLSLLPYRGRKAASNGDRGQSAPSSTN